MNSTDTKITVRKAFKSDVNTLIAFRIAQLIDEGQAKSVSIEKALDEFFISHIDDKTADIFIAEIDGSAVACAMLLYQLLPPAFTNPDGKTAFATNIYTLPQHRGKGCAKRLVKILLNTAREKGCSFVRLKPSKMGRPLYEKLGFKDDNIMINPLT